MRRTELDDLFADVLADRQLLTHAFYRRWEAGTLAPGELGDYAGQYRHFEAALPGVLEAIVAGLGDADAARAAGVVAATLADERGVPAPHIELFDAFVGAVDGAVDAEPTPA